jgi:hypothetical protein
MNRGYKVEDFTSIVKSLEKNSKNQLLLPILSLVTVRNRRIFDKTLKVIKEKSQRSYIYSSFQEERERRI